MAPSVPSNSAPGGFLCPMHRDVRQATPGTCPKCGMDLIPEGSRFGLLRHMASMPKHILHRLWMLVLMAAIMAALMVLLMRLVRRSGPGWRASC